MKSFKIILQSSKLILLISLVNLIIFSSCTIERQLSKDFQKYSDSVSVLVVGGSVLNKSSLVIAQLYPQFNELSPDLQDTVWKHQTKFLDVVSDSMLLELYYESVLQKLKKTKIKVYNDSQTSEFLKQSGVKWIFRVGQIQLEEDKQKVDFSAEIKNQEELYKNLEIEVLSLNVWLEMFKSENDTAPEKIFYTQKTISDEVDGRFFSTDENETYEFRYKRTDLTKDDLIKLAKVTGELNAQQIVDYLFTQYIKRFYPESEKFYGFDIDKQYFYTPNEKDQFIEVKK